MTLGIYTPAIQYLPLAELRELLHISDKYSFEFYVNTAYAKEIDSIAGIKLKSYTTKDELPEDTKFMLSYGGDGTFLKCVKIIDDMEIPILGINSGHLGFLLSTHFSSARDAIESIIKGDYTIETRNMLRIEGKRITTDAFNEFTIQKSDLSMISVDMNISSEYITTYKADGLIISTPSGSTAYSLSAGGPIVSPKCNCFIITPIAPHNLTMRPLIIDNSSIITLTVHSRKGKAIATIDNQSYKIENYDVFTLSLSPTKVNIIKLKGDSYFETLTNKLMWASGSSGDS